MMGQILLFFALRHYITFFAASTAPLLYAFSELAGWDAISGESLTVQDWQY